MSTSTVFLVVVLELLVVVMLCTMGFRCWYVNKKASIETAHDDETKLTDKCILGRYDETMT